MKWYNGAIPLYDFSVLGYDALGVYFGRATDLHRKGVAHCQALQGCAVASVLAFRKRKASTSFLISSLRFAPVDLTRSPSDPSRKKKKLESISI